MLVKDTGKAISVRAEHPLKADAPMLVTDEGIVTFDSEVHSWNVLSLISATDVGNAISVRAEHP
jgi:hypothetical protein